MQKSLWNLLMWSRAYSMNLTDSLSRTQCQVKSQGHWKCSSSNGRAWEATKKKGELGHWQKWCWVLEAWIQRAFPGWMSVQDEEEGLEGQKGWFEIGEGLIQYHHQGLRVCLYHYIHGSHTGMQRKSPSWTGNWCIWLWHIISHVTCL